MKSFREERAAAMAAAMVEVLPQVWAEQIERAIDKVTRPKRTAWDKWFRKQWYRADWRNRRNKGAMVEHN